MLAALALALLAQESPREHGVSVRWYFIGEPQEKLQALVPGQTPNVSKILPVLDLQSDAQDRVGELQYTFLAVCDGWLDVPAGGKYTLRLTSDDGSTLDLDGKRVIDHDGLHATSAKEAELDLAPGQHPFLIRHFQDYGGWALKLEWKKPGDAGFALVPNSSLWCPSGEVRVTAPGPKKLIRPLPRGTPGDGMPLDRLNPAYALATLRPPGFEPKVGGLAFTRGGDLLVSTWDAEGCVYRLSGVQSGDASKVTIQRMASGLAEPLGLCVVGERIFVLQKQELTELIDLDHDGLTDTYSAVCSAWNVSPNFHEFAFGLVFQDGWFYANLAVAIDPGGKSSRPQIAGRGETIRIELADGRHVETVAHGLRTPNGIGIGVDNEIFLTDNQGDWLPSSKLLHLAKGAFYGSRAVLLDQAKDLAVTPPVLWLPHNEISNSPSTPLVIPPGHGPYSGQMCHGDVTYGGLQRDVVEKVEGQYQGCVLRWTQGLEAGVNRIVFGPDGALYLGGIGGPGNWGQEGKLRYGLQRLAYRGPAPFDLLALRARTNGFEVELTQPLAEGAGWDPQLWEARQWRYVPTEQYGGPKVDEEALHVRSASVAADRTHVFLEVEGLKEGRVVYLHALGPLLSEGGSPLWSSEAWYTLNRIPRELPGRVLAAPKAEHNRLGDAERAQGWKLLFDGTSVAQWRGYKQDALPAHWSVEDGALACAGGGGDLVSREEYQDFELELDWKIAPGGNSGIFFHVSEDHDHVWESGPEMQILDDERHPDGQNPLTSAGANYALVAPPSDVTRPVGTWNHARLLVRGSHVEHWLNGVKLLEYELWSPEWKALVARSKFASMPAYGLAKMGRIALQDHGDRVWFRDIKLRALVR